MMEHKNYANGKRLTAPVLPAFEFLNPDYGPVWIVWCSSCEIIHMHAAKEGHRAAHCVSSSSIFSKSGYVLKFSGKVKSCNEVRPGKAFLQGFNALGRRAAIEMRLTLLQSWFPEGSHLSRVLYEAGKFTAEVGSSSAVSLDLDYVDWEY